MESDRDDRRGGAHGEQEAGNEPEVSDLKSALRELVQV